jgi:hypothetical protein
VSQPEDARLACGPTITLNEVCAPTGRLFITVLAYQGLQFLRVKLKAAGITHSWATLRDILSVQRRVTATFHPA